MDVAAGDEVAMAYNSTPSSAGTQVVQNFTLVLRGTTDFAPRDVPWKNTAVLGSIVVIINSRQPLT